MMITMRRMTIRWRTSTRTMTSTRTITITMIRVSQPWDKIETWGFHEDIKDIKGIKFMMMMMVTRRRRTKTR